MGRRCAAWVWYRGDAFRGFQQQPGGQTVQQALELAFERAGAPLTVMPAGRTDRGVSARMQVVSFRTPDELDPAALRLKVEAALPSDVLGFAERWITPADSFHAQWSARAKEYRYRVALSAAAPKGPWARYVWHLAGTQRLLGTKIDAAQLEETLRGAVGMRDFSAFHEKGSVNKPRTLQAATVAELGDGVFEVRLVGDSFGRHQVRYLVGTAALVAGRRLSAELYTRALQSAERIDGLRAPAEALILWEVLYPPAVDPFSAEQRSTATGVPAEPPFGA